MSQGGEYEAPVERRRSTDEAVDQLSGLVRDFIEATEANTKEVIGLRRDLAHKESKAHATYRRRLATALVVALVLAVIQVVDIHTESCGPGHRSEPVVSEIRDAIRDGRPIDPDRVAEVIDEASPGAWCGLTFPTHDHNRGDDETAGGWPQRQHVAGITIYVMIFGGLAIGVIRARRALQKEPQS